MIVDPRFASLIESFPGESLDSKDVVFGLWADLRIAYFNDAWEQFARDNGGPARLWSTDLLGTNVLDVTSAELRSYYRDFFSASLTTPDTLRPLQHEFECSSPEHYRLFQMSVFPLRYPNADQVDGLLVASSLRIERPHDREAHGTRSEDYRDEQGFFHQCAHCRRTSNLTHRNRWDWVPDLVTDMPAKTSHTLCPLCFQTYWRTDRLT